MAIQKNAGSDGGNFIKEPGEYLVKVQETKTGTTKTSGKPMLTVTFVTHDEKNIRAYFVKALTFHMKSLELLKIACGLKVTDTADRLIGKQCGILVEAQEPDTNGRVFMQIVGYGTPKELSDSQGGGDFAPPAEDDGVPF